MTRPRTRFSVSTTLLLSLGTLLTGAAIIGCAAAPPTAQMAKTGAGIRAAEEVGAKDVPAAALHLKLAQDEAAQAQQFVKDGHIDRARSTLLRAEVDAEMAIALTKERQQAGRAQQQLEKVRDLKQSTE